MENSAQIATKELVAINDSKMELVSRRITIKPETIEKMKRFYTLYANDLGENAKEADIISFFLHKTFEAFVTSGEIEKRVLEIAGKG
jgi:hypothetical protein